MPWSVVMIKTLTCSVFSESSSHMDVIAIYVQENARCAIPVWNTLAALDILSLLCLSRILCKDTCLVSSSCNDISSSCAPVESRCA